MDQHLARYIPHRLCSHLATLLPQCTSHTTVVHAPPPHRYSRLRHYHRHNTTRHYHQTLPAPINLTSTPHQHGTAPVGLAPTPTRRQPTPLAILSVSPATRSICTHVYRICENTVHSTRHTGVYTRTATATATGLGLGVS